MDKGSKCKYCARSGSICNSGTRNQLPTSEFYDPEGWDYISCSRRKGHKGMHIACCIRFNMHEFAQWTSKEAIT